MYIIYLEEANLEEAWLVACLGEVYWEECQEVDPWVLEGHLILGHHYYSCHQEPFLKYHLHQVEASKIICITHETKHKNLSLYKKMWCIDKMIDKDNYKNLHMEVSA